MKYYVAYGSNLNIRQMLRRCPGAKLVRDWVLINYELQFRGSKTGAYLTVVKKKNGTVPVAVWKITEEDEKRLDRYEGFPMVYKTEQSVFDWWMNPDEHESELDDLQDAGPVYEGESYADFFENHKDIECYEGLRYLIYIMRADWDKTKAFIKKTKGKLLSEIEIPKSDAEEEWENGEDED